MGKTDEPTVLADVKAALRKGGSTRSPLFQWMLRNHDELIEAFEETPPNWTQVTRVLAERGFTGVDGRPLQPQSVRRLWHRVRQSHARALARKRARTAIPSVLEPVVMEITEAPPPRIPRIQPARPRHMATGEPLAPPIPVPMPEGPTAEEIEERTRKIDEALKSRSGRMPDPIFEDSKDGR